MVTEAHICGGCGTEFARGDHVCLGCHGRIVYGALPEEISKEAGAAGALWAFISFAVIFLLPVVVSSCFGVIIPIGLGLGLWGLLVVFGAWGLGYRSGRNKAVAARVGMCRTVVDRGRS